MFCSVFGKKCDAINRLIVPSLVFQAIVNIYFLVSVISAESIGLICSLLDGYYDKSVCMHASMLCPQLVSQAALMKNVLYVDEDFEPQQQDSDDEETIEKDEREHKNVSFGVLEPFVCNKKS